VESKLLLKRNAACNPSPIFHFNGSVTVTVYRYFKWNEIVSSYYKKVTSYIAELLLRSFLSVMGISNDIVTIPKEITVQNSC
jgi:hypothetical protein